MKKLLSSSLVIALLLAAGAFWFYKYYYTPRMERSTEEILSRTEIFLVKKVLVDSLLVLNRSAGSVYEFTARMPMRFTPDTLKEEFERFASENKDMTVSCGTVKNESVESLSVEVESPFRLVCKIRFVRNPKPKIALILDDWGYNEKSIPYLMSIKQPFTAAVLPGLRYSAESAEEAHKNKKAVMLHLPMQPDRKLPLEKETVMADMDRGMVSAMVDRLLKEVPYFTGVNNHQGSLVTSKKAVITTVLEVLKEKGLFFIDSLTSPKTVAYITAKELGMRYGKRDVFIDNMKEVSYNEKQINKLKEAARKKGWAIGIGHDDPVTLKTLSRMMPEIAAEGFEFVYVAELLQ